MKDRAWNFGYGAVCCLKHGCAMTILGGCPECNEEMLREMKNRAEKQQNTIDKMLSV